MALPVTPRLTSQTPDATRGADLVKRALDPLLRDPFVSGGVLVTASVTGGVPFVVSHGLGRSPTGVFVVKVSPGLAMIMVMASSAISVNVSTQLCLVASGTGTISLRVF